MRYRNEKAAKACDFTCKAVAERGLFPRSWDQFAALDAYPRVTLFFFFFA